MKKGIIFLLFVILVLSISNLHALTFSEIQYNQKVMTELQFKEYFKSLEGTEVTWWGYVYSVDRVFFSYNCVVVLNETGSPRQYVSFDLPKAKAIKLNKGEFICFEGKIQLMSTLLHLTVHLKDVELIE